MKARRGKLTLLLAFSFIGSYLTLVIIFPYSYWKGYFSMTTSRLIIDILGNLVFCMVMITLSLFIDRKLDKRISWTERPLKRLFVQTVLQVLGAISVIIVLGTLYSVLNIGGPSPVEKPVIGVRESLYTILAFILWSLMISALNTGDFLLRNWKSEMLKSAELEIKAAQSKQLASEIELQALKLQLDPHFVFNNLSVLSELILQDQQLGYEYTMNFSKVYRYLLINSKKKLISLHEELLFLDAYLFLIRNRMGEGCVFHIDIDASKLDMLIPPVTLQLFIENALKYNRTEEDNPLVVNIYSNDDDELVVSNTLLPLIRKINSTGIGLKNIFDRYVLLGERAPSVVATDETFTVKVPLIK